MGGNDVEADACAWWQLPGHVQRFRFKHGDYRISAGYRLVAQKNDRLSAGRHFDCAGWRGLAGQFARVGAFHGCRSRKSQANTVRLRGHCPRLRQECGQAGCGEPVVARSQSHV